ncbi:MAG: carbohydrate porin [Acidobacteria bacterium]|nr:carbohydrate porin [Acidobacteriota bacterium]MBS1866752.1 carbohydrate porin [Acidobacteriota bacterium]
MERVLLRRSAWLALLILYFVPRASAQLIPAASDPQPQTPPAAAAESPDSQPESPALLPHLETGRLWLSGQANFISQYHPNFHSPYSGPNSLSPEAQDASSRVLTLFTGLRLTNSAELLCDVQESGGHGIGEALGLAGFTNLDVVRNPTLGKAPYVARLMWHQVIPLGKNSSSSERTPFSLFSRLPDRRLEIRFGKFALNDFLDLNSYGSDSNFQFLNWTVDNNGAWDYAADTRGYTFAALVEYHDVHWSLRFAEALMPKVANGIHLDPDLSRARAENVELEFRRTVLPHREGTLRLLTFVNHANMGSYREAVANFLNGLTPKPEITAHPLTTSIKYGFALNFEQPLNDWLGVFGRWGWNEGQHESYVYTEVDQTVELGLGAAGNHWSRKFDRAALAFVSNGISRNHQQYLALGGSGFLLGDGRLTYGRENIAETYYTLHVWRGVFTSFDFQYISNPGYNRDRGPIFVPALRLHLEF